MEEGYWTASKGNFYSRPWKGGEILTGRIPSEEGTVYHLQYIPQGKTKGIVMKYIQGKGLRGQLTDEEVITLLGAKSLFRCKNLPGGLKNCFLKQIFKSLEDKLKS